MSYPELEERIAEAISRGEYPDRKAAATGIMKQLIDRQRGLLKGRVTGDPVALVDKVREERWSALVQQAGGDEDKAVALYLEELRKLTA